MLNFVLIFLIIALAAVVLGLGGLAGTVMYAAKLLLIVFVIVFLVNAVMGSRTL